MPQIAPCSVLGACHDLLDNATAAAGSLQKGKQGHVALMAELKKLPFYADQAARSLKLLQAQVHTQNPGVYDKAAVLIGTHLQVVLNVSYCSTPL